MQLLQYGFQLFRDRQAKVRGVLHEAHTFIGDVEKDHRRPEHAAGTDHLRVEDVADAHQQEDEHFFEDALEADLAG